MCRVPAIFPSFMLTKNKTVDRWTLPSWAVPLGHAADVSASPLGSFPPLFGYTDNSYAQANISLGWLNVDLLRLTAAGIQQLLLAVVHIHHKTTQTSTQTSIYPQGLTEKVCLHSASRRRLHLFHLVCLLLHRISDMSSECCHCGEQYCRENCETVARQV